MDILSATIRLIITFIAAFIFGLERQRAHKPTGFGTFIFVALGSCTLGVITSSGDIPNGVSLLAATVTGIGFLGAGALIKGSDKVFGFTTAAAIWLFAIFGLTVGIKEYFLSLIIYILMWIVILFDKHLEIKGIGSYQRKLSISTNKIIKEQHINNYLLTYTKRYKILSAEAIKETNELKFTYLIESGKTNINKLISSLYKEEWIKSAKIE